MAKKETRPPNSWVIYLKEQRELIQNEESCRKPLVFATLGRNWRNLSALEKEPYESQALEEQYKHQALNPSYRIKLPKVKKEDTSLPKIKFKRKSKYDKINEWLQSNKISSLSPSQKMSRFHTPPQTPQLLDTDGQLELELRLGAIESLNICASPSLSLKQQDTHSNNNVCMDLLNLNPFQYPAFEKYSPQLEHIKGNISYNNPDDSPFRLTSPFRNSVEDQPCAPQCCVSDTLEFDNPFEITRIDTTDLALDYTCPLVWTDFLCSPTENMYFSLM